MAENVKVRIALAIDPDGQWAACGGNCLSDDEAMASAVDPIGVGERRYIVTVEIPLPIQEEIAGSVEEDNCTADQEEEE